MKTIYVVEDHDAIREGVVRYLEISGYKALGQSTLTEERKAIEAQLPDLIIQDVMLPDGDGFLYIKELKKRYPDLPVIFMTARSEESDRILGFELGADDYISKPFSPKELVLRVAALFRRLDKSGVQSDDLMSFSEGDNSLEIDNSQHRLTINGQEVTLTAAEWRIVTYLAQNEGKLISRAQILEKCFDYSFESYERVVDTHIKNIRAKLRPGEWIETVRGYGYRFSVRGQH
ncbi:MAG: response regulator transcription factor [Spirochaetes bacterium]|uniref:Response regulator transcription factor n=1 Tax=Candidatus Aphodenecus pullistercoris TaxID=2840669 RepID=A0A9D9HAV0_9SPIR|nr:response regulator transcription factor [Candidatus Aphodenecus pullistercoris]